MTVVVQPSAEGGWDVSIEVGIEVDLVQTHTRKRDAVIAGRRLARHLGDDLQVFTPSGRFEVERAEP